MNRLMQLIVLVVVFYAGIQVGVFYYPVIASEDIEPKTAPNSAVGKQTDNPCAHSESRRISFSSWEGKDTATIQVLGADCDSSFLIFKILSANGRYIFSEKIVRLSGVTAYRETADTMPEMLKQYWQEIGPRRTSEIGEWMTKEEMFEARNEWSDLDKDEYDRARAADSPLICMRVYYETTHCYWFDVEKNSPRRLVSYGA